MAAQNDTPAVGVQLDAAIREKRTTQTAVAKAAGLSKSYVGKIIAGKVRKPNDANLRKLEAALGLRRGYFKVPTSQRASDDPLVRIEDVQRSILDQISELTKGLDGLTDLVEDALAKAGPAQRRKPRTG